MPSRRRVAANAGGTRYSSKRKQQTQQILFTSGFSTCPPFCTLFATLYHQLCKVLRHTKPMRKKYYFIILVFIIYGLGFIPAEQHLNPVVGATVNSWNPQSFWYYPWGKSGTHKGIDIFAEAGTPVVASTNGIILYSGSYGRGGQVIYLLGANWHFHYFAHLQQRHVSLLSYVHAGESIGTVGNTGNAKGKPPHLHYSISTLLPRIWLWNPRTHASWQRLFYLDPGKFIESGGSL